MGVGHVLLILDTGKVACHSPSLCATPRHISGLRRSWGLHTLPGIYLYRRPFSNRANRVGASLWRASKEWESVSSIHGRLGKVNDREEDDSLSRSIRTSVPLP